MRTGTGFSGLDDSAQAGKEAAENAVKTSGSPDLTFLFTTDNYEQEQVYSAVKGVVGNSRLIGICAAGIIYGEKVCQKGVGVQTLAGKELRVTTAIQPDLSDDPYKAGELAGESLAASGIESGVVFVFPDGFSLNIAEMLRGLYSRMGPAYQYMGGGAGDNLKFFKTYQFTENKIGTNSVTVALVSGMDVRTAIGHGWKPTGDPLVTVTKGKSLLEINGRPAFDEYAERVRGVTADKFTEYAMRHPLGFPDFSGNYVIRDPYHLNPDKSMDFVTEVPNNAVGSIMRGDVDELVEAARVVAQQASEGVYNPQSAIVCDCISRYLVMGDKFEKELETIHRAMGDQVSVIGALTFGEIGCFEDVPLLHNKTFAVAVLGTDDREG